MGKSKKKGGGCVSKKIASSPFVLRLCEYLRCPSFVWAAGLCISYALFFMDIFLRPPEGLRVYLEALLTPV